MKKGSDKSKKKVHFNDQNLIEVKIFKSTDEPSAPNISKEEYMKIQEEVRKNPHIFKNEEIRKKEITMDINQQKEPEIEWKFPKKIKLAEDIETELNEEGKDSQEKKYMQDFCDGQLRVRYFDQIPEPTELEKMVKMFSFTDETIPKIENSQIATKTNDVTIETVLEFWNNTTQKNITKEDLSQLKELLGKVVDIDNDKKQQIIDIAQKQYEETLMSQNYLNGNNININNNLTINNNQRILSMNNYTNPINFNPLNPISNPALSLLNNLRQFPQAPQNIEQNNYPNMTQPYQTMPQNNDTNNLMKMSNQPQGQNMVTNPLSNLANMNYSQFDPNLVALNQMNNFQPQLQNNNNNNTHHQKSNIDQRMILESAHRMNLAKYKTKPCRNYHSSTGCTRGDNCFFIHDPNFKGREIQNFDIRNYERNFPLQINNFIPQTMMTNLPFGNQFNPTQFGIGLQQMMGLAGNMGINNMNNMGQNNEEEMNANSRFNMGQGQAMNMQYDFGFGIQPGQQNINNNMN